MNKTKLASTVLALTAAAAFSLAPLTATAGVVAKVMCAGINSCKGKSACKSATNACKGQNSCKGKGAVKTTKKKCIKKGGTVG